MLTIFTPTYNRKELLSRLKHSLDNQTNKEFEWIIIDDGSTDYTDELVAQWLNESQAYSIRYFKQLNQGKAAAFNQGVKLAKTEWFICVDSDDFFSESAVEIMDNDVTGIDENSIGIVYPQMMESKNNTAWGKIHNCSIDIIDLKELYGIVESAILIRKSVLEKYQFPLKENEKFIPEGWLYQKLIKEGRFIVHNSTFYISEYQDDGLTKNMWKLWAKNSEGVLDMLFDKYYVLSKYPIKTRIISRAKCLINFNTICIAAKKSALKRTPSIIYSLILYIPSLYFYRERFGR